MTKGMLWNSNTKSLTSLEIGGEVLCSIVFTKSVFYLFIFVIVESDHLLLVRKIHI